MSLILRDEDGSNGLMMKTIGTKNWRVKESGKITYVTERVKEKQREFRFWNSATSPAVTAQTLQFQT